MSIKQVLISHEKDAQLARLSSGSTEKTPMHATFLKKLNDRYFFKGELVTYYSFSNSFKSK
jgi:hypothetical protein